MSGMHQQHEINLAEEGNEEEEVERGESSPEDEEFDRYVGALEEVLMEEDFHSLQDSFLERHCEEFDVAEENKLSYSAIHADYVRTVEAALKERLALKIKNFDFNRFEEVVGRRKEELGEDLTSLLLSFGDFKEFKELMLNQKKAKHEEGKELSIIGNRIL